MKIYRVEDVDSIGFYHSFYKHCKDLSLYNFNDHRHHVEPEDDPLIGYFWNSRPLSRREYLFGFFSKSQLRRWFLNPTTRPALSEVIATTNAFRVVTYDIDFIHVVRGEYQCMFKRKDATRISSIPLDQIKNF